MICATVIYTAQVKDKPVSNLAFKSIYIPPTNRVHCYTNCPPPQTSVNIIWPYVWPSNVYCEQFTYWEVGYKTNILQIGNWQHLAFVTNPNYRLYFTNGPQIFVAVRTWDSGQNRSSEWSHR